MHRILLALACLPLPGCAGELTGDESQYLAVAATDDGGSWGGLPGSGSGCPDILEIFTASCANTLCHEGPSAGAQLDLTSPNLESRLVGVASNCGGRPLVDPDAPDNSFLLEKLESTAPECGSTMPFGSQLDPATLACVRVWVQGLSTAAADAAPGGLP
jgi:hypothetical protein